MSRKREVVLVGCDAGGTMTDIFLVDKAGNFVVGKAATTPKDESIGFIESISDALEHWGISWEKEAKEIMPGILAAVYSGTTMLNSLLTKKREKVGLIITKGFEEILLHEQGAQIHAGYGYQDKMHKAAHIHNEPFIPKKLIRGVTERISTLGEVVIPVYEDEARQATADLLDREVKGIVVLCIFSYLNPVHERKIGEIAREIMKEKGREIPLYLSCDFMPVWRESSRLNALILQAQGAEPARKHLQKIEGKLHESGFAHPLQVILADGGIASTKYPALFKATFSGPIGGLLGARYLSEVMDIPNLVCSDMGGTSFDVGLIMGGEPIMQREVEVVRAFFNIPTLVIDSVGAGAGQFVTIDPESKRIDIGPGSAGADPGPVAYNMGNDIPTVMDCALILGMLNPDYYLGGKVKIYKELALKAIEEKCSAKLGTDPYQFAEGVIALINDRMREFIRSVLSIRGYSPADYHLIGYGGAGPLFLAGYTEGVPFKGVFTVPWAAAFSAFGCCAGDYLHRYQKSVIAVIPPGADEDTKMFMGATINAGWEGLERTAISEMQEEGFKKKDITLKQIVYMRYTGQLEDVEVISPASRINTFQDMDRLIAAFEEMYSRKYTHAGKYPEAGYQVLEVGLHALVPKPQPYLRKYPIEGKAPPGESFKGEREVFTKSQWKKAKLYEIDLLSSGNEIEGLAILEAPSTTMFVPGGRKVRIDEFKRFWLEEA